jgi:putative membrane protein
MGTAGWEGVIVRWVLAAVHLLALGIGLGAVWARGRALRAPLDVPGVRRVLYADTWWGLAAILWIGTGVARAFGGFEKGTLYYTHNHYFWVKMGLLMSILLLEAIPIITFIKWRKNLARGEAVDAANATTLATTSFIQAALVVFMVLAATAMARGYGVSN